MDMTITVYAPARKERDATAADRRMAQVLASRDRSETIAYCAEHLGKAVSHTSSTGVQRHLRNPTSRLTRSLDKLAIVMQEKETHREVLEKALALVVEAENAARMDRIAAGFMLAELRGGGYEAIMSAPGNGNEIGKARSRVEDNAGFASHLSGLFEVLDPDPVKIQSVEVRFDWSMCGTSFELRRDLAKVMQIQALRLGKLFGAIYALGKLEPGSVAVRESLEFLSSYGRHHPLPEDAAGKAPFPPDNLCMVAARMMLKSE